MTHTPGPWVASFLEKNQRTHTGEWCFSDGNGRPLLKNGLRSEANARLIAAAPDMLEALLVAETALNNATSGDEYCEYMDDLKAIRAAIAKATSES